MLQFLCNLLKYTCCAVFSLKLIHFGKDVKTTPNMSAIFVRFFARFSSIYIFLFVVSFVIIIVYNEPLADKAAEHTNQIETVLGPGAFPGPNAFSGRKKEELHGAVPLEKAVYLSTAPRFALVTMRA